MIGPEEHPLADHRAAEIEECEVDLRVALPANPQSTEVTQPRERPLHHPPLAAQAGAVIGAATGDPVGQSPAAKFAAVLVVVISAVGDHPLRPLPRPASLAGDRRDAVDQRQQLRDVVAVAAGQRDGQRDPAGVNLQVMLGAGAGTVNRRRPSESPLSRHVYGCRRRSRWTSRSVRPR